MGTTSRIPKGPQARRIKGHLLLDQYETLYAPAFRRAAAVRPALKLPALLAPDVKLPGFGAPTGSTILHFIHPDTMPIMDSRAAECLHEAGLFSTRYAYASHYDEFRRTIDLRPFVRSLATRLAT
jgi:hypothetical protein